MKIEQKPTIGLEITIRLSEPEARALNAMAGYSDDAFLKTFYEQMGKSYLLPHEDGLRSLFDAVRENLPSILRRVDEARKVFTVGAR